MQHIGSLGAAAAVAALSATPTLARAAELEIGATSSYVDTSTFNQKFSDEPGLEISGSVEQGIFFGEAYGRISFEDPGHTSGSEFDIGAGVNVPVGEKANLRLYAGRWTYGGDEPTGDWAVQAEFDLDGLFVSVTALDGVSDTELYRAGYGFAFADETVSVTPSVVYDAANERTNPGLSLSYHPNDHWHADVNVVRDEDGGAAVAFGLFASF